MGGHGDLGSVTQCLEADPSVNANYGEDMVKTRSGTPSGRGLQGKWLEKSRWWVCMLAQRYQTRSSADSATLAMRNDPTRQSNLRHVGWNFRAATRGRVEVQSDLQFVVHLAESRPEKICQQASGQKSVWPQR